MRDRGGQAAFTIRDATAEDASAAAAIIERSIRTLCIADHGNDERKITAWLADKSVERIRQMTLDRSTRVLLAARAAEIIGVTAMSDSGELALLYVDPRALGLGVGRALLEAAEDAARHWGVTTIAVDSTLTAQPFYRQMGYREAAVSNRAICGVVCHPMEKRLSA